VTSHAETVEEVVASAVSKLATVLARELGRRDHHKGSASIRTGSGEDSPPASSTDDDAEPRTEPDPPEG
jgi:hypothetical protein